MRRLACEEEEEKVEEEEREKKKKKKMNKKTGEKEERENEGRGKKRKTNEDGKFKTNKSAKQDVTKGKAQILFNIEEEEEDKKEANLNDDIKHEIAKILSKKVNNVLKGILKGDMKNVRNCALSLKEPLMYAEEKLLKIQEKEKYKEGKDKINKKDSKKVKGDKDLEETLNMYGRLVVELAYRHSLNLCECAHLMKDAKVKKIVDFFYEFLLVADHIEHTDNNENNHKDEKEKKEKKEKEEIEEKDKVDGILKNQEEKMKSKEKEKEENNKDKREEGSFSSGEKNKTINEIESQSIQGKQKSEETRRYETAESIGFLQFLWCRLLEECRAIDKKIKMNACKIVCILSEKACESGLSVYSFLYDRHIQIFFNLLKEKDKFFLKIAVDALQNFQDVEISKKMVECMEDDNAYIRRSAVLKICILPDNLNLIIRAFLKRTFDHSPSVRNAVYLRLQQPGWCEYIPLELKNRFFAAGMFDRNPLVRQSAFQLFESWVEQYGGLYEYIESMMSGGANNEVILDKLIVTYIKKNTNFEIPKGENLRILTPAEIYVLRVFMQFCADDAQKECIDISELCSVTRDLCSVVKEEENKRETNSARNLDNSNNNSNTCVDECGNNNSSKGIQSDKNSNNNNEDKTNTATEEEKNNSADKEENNNNNQDDLNDNDKSIKQESGSMLEVLLCTVRQLVMLAVSCLDVPFDIAQKDELFSLANFLLLHGPFTDAVQISMVSNTSPLESYIENINEGRKAGGGGGGGEWMAYWMCHTIAYAAVFLFKKMQRLSEKDSLKAENNFTQNILHIISDIKEPFNAEIKDSDGYVSSSSFTSSPSFSRSTPVFFSSSSSFSSTSPSSSCLSKLDKKISGMSIVQLKKECRRINQVLENTELKIRDLVQLQVDARQLDFSHHEEKYKALRDQIESHSEFFEAEAAKLQKYRNALKNRWIRILVILDAFLSQTSSDIRSDSCLSEFPSELLLPALNFFSHELQNWRENQNELQVDDFAEILVTKCLGSWCILSDREDELEKQIGAFNITLNTTIHEMQNYIVEIYNSKNVVHQLLYNNEHPNESNSNTDLLWQHQQMCQQLELYNLKCDLYISALGDLMNTHPTLQLTQTGIDAVDKLWSVIGGHEKTSKHVQATCLRVAGRLLITQITANQNLALDADELKVMKEVCAERLRALLEITFFTQPFTFAQNENSMQISSTECMGAAGGDMLYICALLSAFASFSPKCRAILNHAFVYVLIKSYEGILDDYEMPSAALKRIVDFSVNVIAKFANRSELNEMYPAWIKFMTLFCLNEKNANLFQKKVHLVSIIANLIKYFVSFESNFLQEINFFSSSLPSSSFPSSRFSSCVSSPPSPSSSQSNRNDNTENENSNNNVVSDKNNAEDAANEKKNEEEEEKENSSDRLDGRKKKEKEECIKNDVDIFKLLSDYKEIKVLVEKLIGVCTGKIKKETEKIFKPAIDMLGDEIKKINLYLLKNNRGDANEFDEEGIEAFIGEFKELLINAEPRVPSILFVKKKKKPNLNENDDEETQTEVEEDDDDEDEQIFQNDENKNKHFSHQNLQPQNTSRVRNSKRVTRSVDGNLSGTGGGERAGKKEKNSENEGGLLPNFNKNTKEKKAKKMFGSESSSSCEDDSDSIEIIDDEEDDIPPKNYAKKKLRAKNKRTNTKEKNDSSNEVEKTENEQTDDEENKNNAKGKEKQGEEEEEDYISCPSSKSDDSSLSHDKRNRKTFTRNKKKEEKKKIANTKSFSSPSYSKKQKENLQGGPSSGTGERHRSGEEEKLLHISDSDSYNKEDEFDGSVNEDKTENKKNREISNKKDEMPLSIQTTSKPPKKMFKPWVGEKR